MKRAFVIVLVAIVVMGLALAAYGKPDKPKPNRPTVAEEHQPVQPDLDRQPGGQAVVDEHIDALNNCDVDRLMAQYPESIHILLPGGVTVEGRADVRDLFEGFCLPYPDGLAGLQFTEVATWTVGNTFNVQWSADACFLNEPYLGADAYETHANLMAAQVTTFDGAELVANPNWEEDCGVNLRKYYTTAGALSESQVGNILAHDHMFVEFGVADPVAYLDAKPQKVYKVIGPLVEEAKSLGFNVFVDTGPDGIGRRPDIVKYIADKSGMPTMMVTGVYSEPNIPAWVYDATVAEISAWLQKELNEGIEDTGVQAGFIKLSQSWGGATATEMKVLEAACDAALQTNSSVASHILQGPVALDVIDAFEAFGCDAERFIWVHAPYTAFTDSSSYLLAAAEKGAFISHDFIGSKFWAGWLSGDNNDARQLALIQELIDGGYEDQIIIGQDSGWYDPGFPEGFEVQGYDHLARVFVPLMEDAGFSEELIHKLLHDNPWNAYSR